jgi:Zn-dependent protease
MGKPFGVPIYVAPTWFLIAAFITVAFAPSDAEIPGLGGWRYLVSFSFAVLLYLSVIAHELAHSVVAKRIGLPVRHIAIYFLGGVSQIDREPDTPGREFAVAVAGPLLSLVLAGIGYLVWYLLPNPHSTAMFVVTSLVGSTFGANLLVAAFNLLPGLPLDGGRVLRAIIWAITKNPMTGTRAAAWIGRGLAVALVILALRYGALGHQFGFYLLFMGLFLAIFIWSGASQTLKLAELKERLPTIKAGELARPALSVDARLPLAEALRRANEAGARAIVVVTSEGEPTALVDEAAVVATPEQRRPWVDVVSVARTLEPGMILRADMDGEELINAMRAAPASEYLVVEADGSIRGVLATTDVQRAVS